MLPHELEHGHAARPRHFVIEQNQIKSLAAQMLDRVVAVMRLPHFMPLICQQDRQDGAANGGVISDQYLCHEGERTNTNMRRRATLASIRVS
jgi:hypothetical protein